MGKFNISFPKNKCVDVDFKTFKLKTDQSVKNGGESSAIEPFDMFLSSLGSCAGIYAKSFCDSRKFSTSGMHLTLEAFFKKGQKQMDKVEIMLFVNQSFPEKYIKAIIKAMNGCAVKNQLHPDLNIQTTISYLQD